MQKQQKEMNYDACLSTPFANLGLRFEQGSLVAIDFVDTDLKVPPASVESKNVCKQIQNYCAQKSVGKSDGMHFDIKLNANGTAFQKKVWKELQKIPEGKTVTYGELAQRLKTSARAVGNACRNNPLPIVIPCHRVVSKTGLGGYAGSTSGNIFKIKEWLLKHESALPGS